MKKVVVIALLMIFIIYPVEVFANITCNDGTISPSCSDCHQGCCSHHGGCLREEHNYYNEDEEYSYYYENDGYEDSEDNSILYLLGIGGAITGGYYIGKKRSDK